MKILAGLDSGENSSGLADSCLSAVFSYGLSSVYSWGGGMWVETERKRERGREGRREREEERDGLISVSVVSSFYEDTSPLRLGPHPMT